ncbi:MAG: ABC transporter permease, partial [Bryobacteraceae bacterium]
MQGDLRYGARMLLKGRGATAAAVVALALGIGANSTVFSVVHAVLLRPLPFPQEHKLVRVWERNPQQGLYRFVSAPNFIDWRAESQAFSEMSAMVGASFNLVGGIEPERIQGALVSANFFRLLGSNPVHGRAFVSGEDVAGRERVVVLSHGYWQRRFGGEVGAIGRAVVLNNRSYTIIGVLPPQFQFFGRVDVWAPLVFQSEHLQARGLRLFTVIARTRREVTLDQARARMEAVAQRLEGQSAT